MTENISWVTFVKRSLADPKRRFRRIFVIAKFPELPNGGYAYPPASSPKQYHVRHLITYGHSTKLKEVKSFESMHDSMEYATNPIHKLPTRRDSESSLYVPIIFLDVVDDIQKTLINDPDNDLQVQFILSHE